MLIGGGVGVVVLLLLAGALLLRPAPYEFMRGARLDGVGTYSVSIVLVGKVVPAPSKKANERAERQYWLPQSLSEIEKSATLELNAEGWKGPLPMPDANERCLWFKRGVSETINILPAEGGGSEVFIESRATPTDRFRAWLWNLTHR